MPRVFGRSSLAFEVVEYMFIDASVGVGWSHKVDVGS